MILHLNRKKRVVEQIYYYHFLKKDKRNNLATNKLKTEFAKHLKVSKKQKILPCCQRLARAKLARETPISKANFLAESQLQNSSCESSQKPVSKQTHHKKLLL